MKSATEEIQVYEELFYNDKPLIEPLLQEIHQLNASLITEVEKSKDIEGLKTVIAHLKRALGTMKALKSKAVDLPIDESSIKQPDNTKIVRQDKFRSTKKAKTTAPSNLTRPSNHVKQTYRKMLTEPDLVTIIRLNK